MTRILLILSSLMLVALGTTAPVEAQMQQSQLCVPGIADFYRFKAKSFTQHEVRVYAESNNPGIFLLVFNSSNDVRGSSSSNTRSLYWSGGLIGGTHNVAVACLRQSRYNIHWVSGNEKRLPAPRFVPFVVGMTGLSVNSKLSGGDLEFNGQIEEQLLRHFNALAQSGGSK